MRLRQKVYLRRNLIRVAWYLAVPIMLLVAARLLWGMEAAGRLALAKKALAAQGVDLDRPPPAPPSVAADRDPATALALAGSKVNLTRAQMELLFEGDGRSSVGMVWTDAHKPLVREALSRQRAAFDQVDVAMGMGDIPGGINRAAGSLRSLADVLRDDAIIAHEDGQEARAIHRLRQILFISRVDDAYRTFSEHLSATGLRELATNTFEQVYPTLRLDPGDGGLAEAREFLRDLLDVEAFKSGLALGEEQRARAIGPRLASTRPGLDSWWIRPLFAGLLSGNLQAEQTELMASHTDNFPQARSYVWAGRARMPYPRLEGLLDELLYGGHTLPGTYGLEEHFDCLSDSAAEAMLLAAQIYRQENAQFPESAANLVPGLLPAVPVDPFTKDHQPMHYRLDPGGPTVWSVGEDGIDGLGIVGFGASGTRRDRSLQVDRIYGAAWNDAAPPLVPRPPPKAPTTSRGK